MTSTACMGGWVCLITVMHQNNTGILPGKCWQHRYHNIDSNVFPCCRYMPTQARGHSFTHACITNQSTVVAMHRNHIHKCIACYVGHQAKASQRPTVSLSPKLKKNFLFFRGWQIICSTANHMHYCHLLVPL